MYGPDLIPGPLKVAVFGLGTWGMTLVRTLIETLSPIDQVFAFDPDRGRARLASERFPTLRLVDSDAQLLSSDMVAAFIATPTSLHAELARRALQADLHTYVDTPLAMGTEEAEALIRLARRRRRNLMTGHIFDFLPAVQTVQERIANGGLGQLMRISGQLLGGTPQGDVSVLWDLGPQPIGLLNRWLDTLPTGVSALLAPDGQSAFLQLGYADGLIAALELSWTAPSRVQRMVLSGAASTLAYDAMQAHQPVRELGYTSRARSFVGEVSVPSVRAPAPIQGLLRHFLAAVRSDQPPALDNAPAAVEVVRVLQAAQVSINTGTTQQLRPRAPVASVANGT